MVFLGLRFLPGVGAPVFLLFSVVHARYYLRNFGVYLRELAVGDHNR